MKLLGGAAATIFGFWLLVTCIRDVVEGLPSFKSKPLIWPRFEWFRAFLAALFLIGVGTYLLFEAIAR